MRHFIFVLSVFSLFFSFISPAFAAVSTTPQLEVPDTVEEAKEGILNIGDKVITAIPQAIASIWNNQVIPAWKGMGKWTKKEVWEKRIVPALEAFLDRIKTLLGQEIEKRKPLIEQEFEKEKQELREDIREAGKDAGKGLWERFQALFRKEVGKP